MNTVFQILRKDSRIHFFGPVLWILFLLSRLLIDLVGSDHEPPVHGIMELVFLPFLLAALGNFIMAVGSDALGNHNAFYRTRPIRLWQIMTAKLLFFFLWIILPSIAADCLNLVVNSLPIGFILTAAGERLLLTSLFGIGLVGMVTASRGKRSDLNLALAGMPFVFLTAWALALVAEHSAIPALRPTSMSGYGLLLWGLSFAAIGTFAAFRAARRMQNRKELFVYFALAFAIPPVFYAQWQQGLGQLHPELREIRSETPTLTSSFDVEPQLRHDSQNPDRIQLDVTVTPLAPPPLSSTIYKNQITSLTVKDSAGSKIGTKPLPWPGPIFPRRNFAPIRQADVESIGTLLPPDSVLIASSTGTYHRRYGTGVSTYLQDSPPATDAKVNLEGTLLSRGYTWRKATELPLQSNTKHRVAVSKFQIYDLNLKENGGFDIGLIWHYPALLLTRNQRWRSCDPQVLTRYEFVVYDQESQVAYSPESSYRNPTPLPLRSFQKAAVTLQFRFLQNQVNLSRPNPETSVLMVFERVFTSEQTYTWSKTSSPLERASSSLHSNNLQTSEKIEHQAYLEGLARLGATPLKADRTQAGRYLYAVAKLVTDRDIWINADDELTRRLIPLAHEHPTLFLDGLKSAPHRAAQLLRSVILAGFGEDQRELILSRLRSQPSLAEVIAAKGWITESQEALIQLAHDETNLPISALRCLVLGEAKEVYPNLLTSFTLYPSIESYEALSTIPEIQTQLDEAVHKIWINRPRTLLQQLNWRVPYEIGLRHGKREALNELHRLVHWIHPEHYPHAHGLSQTIVQNVDLAEIPKYERNDATTVLSWLSNQSVERFEYDPVRRLFYLASLQPQP